LRDYYGEKYDSILEKGDCDFGAAAKEIENAFCTAALHATPPSCREGDLRWDLNEVLMGLLRDMMDLTEARKQPTEEIEEIEDEAPRWYKKFGAKMIVLAVNYIQGWLALCSLRRAASQRDARMPKFPLF